jgi:hypothetical protein
MSLVVGDYALCPSLCLMKLNLETYGSSYNKYNQERLIYLISGRQLSGQTSQKFNIEVKDRMLSSYKNPRLEPLSSTLLEWGGSWSKKVSIQYGNLEASESKH